MGLTQYYLAKIGKMKIVWHDGSNMFKYTLWFFDIKPKHRPFWVETIGNSSSNPLYILPIHGREHKRGLYDSRKCGRGPMMVYIMIQSTPPLRDRKSSEMLHMLLFYFLGGLFLFLTSCKMGICWWEWWIGLHIKSYQQQSRQKWSPLAPAAGSFALHPRFFSSSGPKWKQV